MNQLPTLPAPVAAAAASAPAAADVVDTGAAPSPRSSSPVAARRIKLIGGLLSLACSWGALTAASAAAASPTAGVPAAQTVARIVFAHTAYRSPSANSAPVATVPAQTPVTAEPTTLPVIGHANGHDGHVWLNVMLPGRPNGLSGWIAKGGTQETITSWRIYVSLSVRRLSVYLHGRLWRAFSGVVGAAATPTPTGNFFVQETVIMPTNRGGGPFALALSARSDVLQTFDGGPGQIAIHGRDLVGGTLGQAQSNGCVRLATPDISWLAARIGPGVPVTITG